MFDYKKINSRSKDRYQKVHFDLIFDYLVISKLSVPQYKIKDRFLHLTFGNVYQTDVLFLIKKRYLKQDGVSLRAT